MVILDLCGGTGSWSEPYRQAGYTVTVVDPLAEPDQGGGNFNFCGTVQEFMEEIQRDRRNGIAPPHFHGVLIAPPCTEFAGSGARWWKTKPPLLLQNAIKTVEACLYIKNLVEPEWWCLENPIGRLARCVPELGKWVETFQPWEYGDPLRKRTCLWGEFTMPQKSPVDISDRPYAETAVVHHMPPGPERAKLRSITPQGFAEAFRKANP